MTKMGLKDLSLFPATAEQIAEARRRIAVGWPRGMTLDGCMERDQITVSRCDVTREGRMFTWVLAPRDAPASMDFVCSCRTFRQTGLMASAAGEKNTQTEEITCYKVASVFTPVELRKRGYARHMMRLLHWILAPESILPNVFPEEWGAPPTRVAEVGDARASFLWSDVGKEFYCKGCGFIPDTGRGWVTTESNSTVWNVNEFREKMKKLKSDRPLTWIEEGALQQFWDLDARTIKQEFQKLSGNHNRPIFTFLPNNGVAYFPLRWSEGLWKRMSPQPKHWGIYSPGKVIDLQADLRTQNVFDDEVIFATWTFDIPPQGRKTLLVTRLRVTETKGFALLLDNLIMHANEFGLEQVEIWNLPAHLHQMAFKLGGMTVERKTNLPSYKLYDKNDQEITWLHNEKFCWC